jgi:hypothetical protein
VLLALGGRAVGLLSHGSTDVIHFGVWLHAAVTLGVANVYLPQGTSPDAALRFDDYSSRVDYPPMAVYDLAAAGHVYKYIAGDLDSWVSIVLALKLLVIAFGIGTAMLIWFTVRRRAEVGVARFATASYWANPALILHSATLGYVDALVALPALGALVAADAQWAWTSGSLLAIAVLTKPQGLLVGPAVLVALMRQRPLWSLTRAFIGGAVTTVVVLAPIIYGGALTGVAQAIGSLLTDGTLSAQAANVWWVLGHALHVTRHAGAMGWTALAVENRIFGLREVLHLPGTMFGLPLSSLVIAAGAWTMVALTVSWAMSRARAHNDFLITAALAAFTVHAYFTLAVQVHENHLVLVLPVLALIAAYRAEYRRLLVALSAIIALNLMFFYGFGMHTRFELARSLTIVDGTVLLALANIAAFVWHARVFSRVCGYDASRDAASVLTRASISSRIWRTRWMG